VSPPSLRITRVVNACVLVQIGDETVLTDPYFDGRWFMRMREPIGMMVGDLPRLSAIIGGHSVFDHWQPQSLVAYPNKEATPIFVSTSSMARSARAAGFHQVEIVNWGEAREVSPRLRIEVVAAQTVAGRKANNYVLNAHGLRVFVGTEARDLEPLRQYRLSQPRVDVALLPIDGSSLPGRPLVMNPRQAIEGARLLGAAVLVPFHYALKSVPFLLQTPGTLEKLESLARTATDLTVVALKPGATWKRGVGSSG
jgi:L-ascorbate metabolism protein UlaG (beta-lactamase superfamily)